MTIVKKVKGSVTVLLGLQYGDEGKGKITDSMASKYDIVGKFNGGDNAGHTVEENGKKHILHLIPSGILHRQIKNVIGNGVTINPVSLMKELDDLFHVSRGAPLPSNLFVSDRATLLTWIHPLLDRAEAMRCGKDDIGSTGRGIGPSYRDDRGRQGLRVGDIKNNLPDFIFSAKIKKVEEYQMADLKKYEKFGYVIDEFAVKRLKEQWFKDLEKMRELNICDTSHLLKLELEKGSKILAEGAQSVMLDIHFGDYPNVTSSDTITAGVAIGLGVPISSIVSVGGVIKAYSTKVGGGKFLAKMENEEEEEAFRKDGVEFGASTGRPRACGYLDLFQIKHAIYLSDTSKVYMNKADICPASVKTIKVITGYLDKNGKLMESYPLNLNDVVGFVKVEFNAWGNKKFDKHKIQTFPIELLNYLNFIDSELSTVGARLTYVGTGPDRNDFVKYRVF